MSSSCSAIESELHLWISESIFNAELAVRGSYIEFGAQQCEFMHDI
jgi:hypothetical protein